MTATCFTKTEYPLPIPLLSWLDGILAVELKTAIKVGLWLWLLLVFGLGLDYGLGFRSDILSHQDPQLRVSHLATTFLYYYPYVASGVLYYQSVFVYFFARALILLYLCFREQRVTGTIVFLLIGLTVLLGNVLKVCYLNSLTQKLLHEPYTNI